MTLTKRILKSAVIGWLRCETKAIRTASKLDVGMHLEHDVHVVGDSDIARWLLADWLQESMITRLKQPLFRHS